jgi:hypothetical protein
LSFFSKFGADKSADFSLHDRNPINALFFVALPQGLTLIASASAKDFCRASNVKNS